MPVLLLMHCSETAFVSWATRRCLVDRGECEHKTPPTNTHFVGYDRKAYKLILS